MAAERAGGDFFSYCRWLRDVLGGGFRDTAERDLFLTNVLKELKGKELKVCTNNDSSFFVERLLEQCNASSLRRLLSSLQPHLPLLARHRCGSHVLQTALQQVVRLCGELQQQGEGEEEEEGEGGTLEDQIRQMSGRMRSDFLASARDVHSSFFLRDLLQVLGGIVPSARKQRRKPQDKVSKGFDLGRALDYRAGQVTEFPIPEGFLEELRAFCRLLVENVKEFLIDPAASPVFQVAVHVVGRKLPAEAQELCSGVLAFLGATGKDKEHSSLLPLVKDRMGSRLLEAVILAMDAKLLAEFYTSHLKGTLVELALHPLANFTLQRALAAALTPSLFSQMIEELLPGVEDIMSRGHLGVLVEMVAGCARHKSQQKEMMSRLMQALHCAKPVSRKRSSLQLLVSLTTYQTFHQLPEDDATSEYQPSDVPRLKLVNYHGSLLAQHLLRFDRPTSLVRSLAESPAGDLLFLACHSAGSHVFNALLHSTTVPDKQKRAVLRRFKGHYFQLACHRSGSRVFDQIWVYASEEMRRSIERELEDNKKELKLSRYGHQVLRNMRADKGTEAPASKKRKMVTAILGD